MMVKTNFHMRMALIRESKGICPISFRKTDFKDVSRTHDQIIYLCSQGGMTQAQIGVKVGYSRYYVSAVWRAHQKLTGQHRQPGAGHKAIRLLWEKAMSVKEIAAQVGYSERQVRTIVRRCSKMKEAK